MEDLKRLVVARGQLKGAITRMVTLKAEIEAGNADADPILLKQKRDRLAKLFDEYNESNLEISLLDPDDTECVDAVEEKYDDLMAFFAKGIKEEIYSSPTASPPPSRPAPVHAAGEGSGFRHPPIQLQRFCGEVGSYQSFIALFNSVIDSDPKLKTCEKLYYLKSYLDGEALALIDYLPLTEESYPVAIDLLKQRYDNKRQLINHHVSSVMDLPVMQRASAACMRQLVSATRQHMGALQNLGAPTSHWDLIIIAIMHRKIDQYTLRAYHLENQSNYDLPKLNDFLAFPEQRAAALEALGDGAPNKRRSSLVAVNNKSNKSSKPVKCKYCNSTIHKLHQCSNFRLAEPQKRRQFVTSNNLCDICLNEHPDKKCFFTFKCATCKGRHNSLLHEEAPPEKAAVSTVSTVPQVEVNQNKTAGQISLLTNSTDNVLLPTIKAKLYDRNGQAVYVRCLLDSGSQVSFVLSEVADQLGCKLQPSKSIITGVCDGVSMTTQQTTLTVHATASDFSLPVTCHVVKNITCNMPQFSVRNEMINFPSNVKLADDNFYVCDKIGILLGADIFFQALLPEQLPVLPGELVLQNTCFGYVVAGRLRSSTSAASTACLASNFCCEQSVHENPISSLDHTITQFWQTEKVPEVYTEANSEQELAEKIFQGTVILKDNKFEVALPLKQDVTSLHLGNSLTCALKRFLNLELRFKKDNDLFLKYKAFIDEYVQLGHAKYVDISKYNLEEEAVFFLPHHPVFNESSQITKLRVVFDGSMPSLAKVSLNDVLLNGSVVQNDLFSILILFRLFKFILNCDIRKMFRAIDLTPSHRPLQNILWRPAPNDGIQCIQLQTVTYGLKSSSFLATRCLLELVNRYKSEFPLAADALLNNTYVDDINLVSNDKTELLEAKTQLISLLTRGGFELHKWCTNNKSLLNDIPPSCQTNGYVHFTDEKDCFVKTLGIKCELESDTLIISAPQQKLHDKYTKRDLLSFVSKLFDPLGLVGPVIVTAKLLVQQTWLEKIEWDSPLPDQLNQRFRKFADSLNQMASIVIKRNLDTSNAKSIEILGYSDASNKAQGCCLYLRTVDSDDNINIDLLCSKSRVNPIDQLTTPRLELNSALLLAKLVKKVYDVMKPKFNVKVRLFVDSQVVLAWLATNPLKLGVYVANRVKCINQLTEGFLWQYINTAENPADCLSRGVEPHLLQNNKLWFHGPAVLKGLDFQPTVDYEMPREIPELKTSHVAQKIEELPLLRDCSNLDKIKRVLAYVYRFVNNCKCKVEERQNGNLTPQELDSSLKIILRCEQMKFFSEEIKCLDSNLPIKSSLQAWNPFLDGLRILRVGGRLHHADIPYATKHPIILPKGSRIVHYLIEKQHRKLMHAGAKLVLSDLSEKYHLMNGIREVKHVLNKCLICFKLKAKNAEQLMGSLPYDRIKPCRVFEKVGIEYGGPFNVKMLRSRNPVIQKSYILIFVCFITKAVHIELATDLTTECFLNALKRFIARRNKPIIIYCDNASTYKGAQNQLNRLYQLQSSADQQSTVERYGADLGITFKFIPSYSPVFAGLWEAGIKSFKYYLKRVVGESVLTYEELNTVLIQIEGILNSRPLTALPTTDNNEMPYLTPGHFLTGASLTSYPEKNCVDGPINRIKFWEQCNRMVQGFWKQWHKQYLVQLQNRPKWRQACDNIKVGTLVIVKDENVTPLRWPMARVVEVFPGADGKVRALSIRTLKGSIVKTSIYKVCVLPIDQ